jgi:hypothetical protein
VTAEPTVKVTEYTVSCLPEDHDGYDSFSVLVEYWPGEDWFVRRASRFLGGEALTGPVEVDRG